MSLLQERKKKSGRWVPFSQQKTGNTQRQKRESWTAFENSIPKRLTTNKTQTWCRHENRNWFKNRPNVPRQSSRLRGEYKENKKARMSRPCHHVEIHVPLRALTVLKVSATTITALTSSARTSTKSVSSQPATRVAADRRENLKPPESICLSSQGVNLFWGAAVKVSLWVTA